MDSFSLMTLVVTYFFAALRQTNHQSEDRDESGSTVIAIAVLVLNGTTLVALVFCLAMDFKWVLPFVYRNVCAGRITAEPAETLADVESHDNPISLEDGGVEMQGGHRRRSSMVFSSLDELDSHGTHSICDGFAADSDRPPQWHASFFSADLEGGIEMETMENVEEEEDMSGTDEEVMPELPEEDVEDDGSGTGVVPQLRNNPMEGSRRSVFARV
jgi:hypothetical protein